MTDDVQRSVSAPEHELTPETVWSISMPPVRFGIGATEELGYELRREEVSDGANGLLVTDDTIADHGHPERVREQVEEAGAKLDVYTDAEREPTVESVQQCVEYVRDRKGSSGYDFYIGLGGGTCMDTAKITRATVLNGGDVRDYLSPPIGEGKEIADSSSPLFLLPTTAGTGSEISRGAIVIVQDEDTKAVVGGKHVRANAAIIDPRFAVTMPASVTAETAMDALGHAMEGYTTHRFNEKLRAKSPESRPTKGGRTVITDAFTERAIRLIANNIRAVVNNGDDIEARAKVQLGAFCGAMGGLTAGAHLCHAMSYPVANRYHTYHGETIAALTPAVTLGFNVPSKPETFARLAELLGADTSRMSTREAVDEARREYVQLQQDLDVLPSGLNELAGITEDDVDWLAKQTVETQQRLIRYNPRPVSVDDARGMFLDALHNW
jgi:alcohol dehydrogenase class IV